MADVINVKTLVRSSWVLWVALDPVTGVLMRLRRGRLVPRRGRVTTGAGTGLMQPQAQGRPEPPGAG